MIKFRGKCKESMPVVDWLSQELDLSKVKIKSVIDLGGLWIKKLGKKKKRVKKIKTQLAANDVVEFYYNPNLSIQKELDCHSVFEHRHYSVWYKGVSIPSDGTPFSDKGCLSYVVKKLHPQAAIINRLDFEVSGLVIVAYSKEARGKLSDLIRNREIQKKYLAIALGDTGELSVIDRKLDGKDAETSIKQIRYEKNRSFLEIDLITGRYHQIRRHLDLVGHPLWGDPRYGKNNKSEDGLKLQAYQLKFLCPFDRISRVIELENEKRIF